MTTRRSFLHTGIAGIVGAHAMPALLSAASKVPLRMAVIGVGGRCGGHYNWLVEEKVTVMCDVDQRWYAEGPQNYRDKGVQSADILFPYAKRYFDYRDVFERPQDFDAVLICTPDHQHFGPAMRAIRAGKPVFCEKPLAWSVEECRQLAAATRKYQVPTQMGNQGMSSMGWRNAHAYYQANAIGDVLEVHAWQPPGKSKPSPVRPAGSDPVPNSLNWDLWLGPAPERPYAEGMYHPKRWRDWVDFGSGELGDWGCHTLNVVFKILEPDYPLKVERAECSAFNRDSFPQSKVIKYTFPAKENRPGFTLHWYDGGPMPPRPTELDAGEPMPEKGGCYFRGTKGVMMVQGGHNNNTVLLPARRHEEYGAPKLLVPKSIGHPDEFVEAAKGNLQWNEPLSNFIYAGHMTAVVNMGNLVLKTKQPAIELDPTTGRILNNSDANQYFGRKPRRGWSASD